jgi:NAD(P)-dependent dehydrogenase (short-subunit alcohol dehydrogenase family)
MTKPAEDGAPPARRFLGRQVAVVGGTEETGRASALRFAAEGADVLVVGTAAAAVRDAVREVASLGVRAGGLTADLAEPEAAAPAARRCGQDGWQVGVLVNCQAETPWPAREEGLLPRWERAIRVSLTGPYAWTKAFLPQLKRSGRGAVVHVSSVDAAFGDPRVPACSAAHGGLVPLTHVMAHEFARFAIRVNLVCRVTTTASRGRADGAPAVADSLRRLAATTALKRLGTPQETAAAVAFLASDEASYITGAVLVADGGRTTLTPGTA